MSWLAQGLVSLALLGIQETKGDPKQRQDSKVETESLLLLAVRNETELRDFAKALESWRTVQSSAEKAGNAALVAKAGLGCARCLHALGRVQEAKVVLNAVLAADPKNVDATALLAKLDAPRQDDDDLKEIVRHLVEVALSLTSAQDDGAIAKARSDLVRMSDVAVPQVAELLRDHRVGVVDGAAYILVQMLSARSFGALSAAMKDPRCRYPKVLVDQASDVGGEVIVPFLEATLTRMEPELRRWAASRLQQSVGDLTPEAQVDVAKRLLEDPDEQIRSDIASGNFSASAVQLLVPTFQALVDSKDESPQKTAVLFLVRNRERIPTEVVSRWSTKLSRSPLAPVRCDLFSLDYDATTAASNTDPRRRDLALLKFLSDDDGSVFSWGASILATDTVLVRSGAFAGSRDAVLAALRRALDLPGVSLDKRYAVLIRLPKFGLSDDELFDLFVQLMEKPRDADDAWRAAVRERIGQDAMYRAQNDKRDAFAAERLPRIPDAAGRRQWFDLARRDMTSWQFPNLDAAAATTDDVKLRVVAYRGLRGQNAGADRLPHLAEDLRSADPAVILAAAEAIGWGERPELVKPLRDVLAQGPGDLHDAALRALAKVGPKEVADELLAAMKAAAKEREFPFLRELERGLGAQRLAEELVAIAKSPGSSERIAGWMGSNGVSNECASDFVRLLPEDLVTGYVLNSLAYLLPPDALGPLICRRLHEGTGRDLEGVAQLAGRYHIEAAWPELVALLDTGGGSTRDAAIEALKSIKEFRELRRTFATDDSDARRAAFEKAKAMTQSKSAEQRAGAAIALAATGDVAAIPLLLDLLGDGDDSVKAAARKALEKLADRAVAPPAEAPKGNAEKGAEGEKGKKKAQ